MLVRLTAALVALASCPGGVAIGATPADAGAAPNTVTLTQLAEDGTPLSERQKIHCSQVACRGSTTLSISGAAQRAPVVGTIVPFGTGELIELWIGPLPGCDTVPPGVPWRDGLSIGRGVSIYGGNKKAVRVLRLVSDPSMTPPTWCKTEFVWLEGEPDAPR